MKHRYNLGRFLDVTRLMSTSIALALCFTITPANGFTEDIQSALVVPWRAPDGNGHEPIVLMRDEVIDENIQRILAARETPDSSRFFWRSGKEQNTFPTADDPAMIEMISRLCQLPREAKVHVNWSVKREGPGYNDRFAEFYFPKGFMEGTEVGCEYTDLIVLSEDQHSRGRTLARTKSGSETIIRLDSYFGKESTEDLWYELRTLSNNAGELMTLNVNLLRSFTGFWEQFIQELGQNNSDRVIVETSYFRFGYGLGRRSHHE